MKDTTIKQKFLRLADFIIKGGFSSGTISGINDLKAAIENLALPDEDQFSLLRFLESGTAITASDTAPLPIKQTVGVDTLLDVLKIMIQNPLWNRYDDAAVLVTAQDLTASYANLGSEIDMRGYTHLGVFVEADVNNSEDVDIKTLGAYESGGNTFEIDGLSVKTLWSGAGTDFTKYYEVDVGAIPFIILQAICNTFRYTPAYLTSGVADSTVANWNAVTDGSFAISIDGTTYNVDALDFSAAITMKDVAGTIQSAIRSLTGSTETVVWSTDHFVISSVLTTSSSSISNTSTSTGTVGTDISGLGASDWLNADIGYGIVTVAQTIAGNLTVNITKIWRP